MQDATQKDWQERLAKARDIKQLVAVAREFVGTFDAEQLASLPPPLRPPVLIAAIDIADYAYELKRALQSARPSGADALELLSRFFSDAAARASTIAATRPRIGGFSSTDIISYRKTKAR